MTDSQNILRVCIVAPVRLYRDGLADALAREGVFVTGSHGDGADLLESIITARPDEVLLDVATPACCATSRAVVDTLGIAVVALGVGSSTTELLTYAESGMTGFIVSHSTVDDLVTVLWSAARGELACSPATSRTLMGRVASLSAGRTTVAEIRFTNREQQIADLLQQELSNKEIADALGIGVATVKHHVHHVLRRLGVQCRHDAVVVLQRAQRGVPTLVPRSRQLREVTQS